MKSSLSVKMATTGGSIGVPGFPSSSYFSREAKSTTITSTLPMVGGKLIISNHRNIMTFAVQESSASTVAAEIKEEAAPAKAAPAKPKPAAKAKAPAKPLPELMEEEVIPSLKATLEAQDDISELELAFGDNRVLNEASNSCSLFSEYLYITSTARRFLSEEGQSLFILGILPRWKC